MLGALAQRSVSDLSCKRANIQQGHTRSDLPFNISRLDGGGTGLNPFLLSIQSIPRTREGLDKEVQRIYAKVQ